MAKYRLLPAGDGVLDQEASRYIPESAENRHWAEYLEWVSDGNTADPEIPAPVETDEDRLNASDQSMIRAVDWLLQYLVGKGVIAVADIPPQLKALYMQRKAQRRA